MNVHLRLVPLAAIVSALLVGCGGGSTPASPAAPVSGTPPPAKVVGVATPKAVSVVTAN